MLLVLLTLACRPDFATVDEACHPAVKGDDNGSAQAVELQHRVDCHRRLAGLDRVRLDPVLSRVAQNHATYMSLNEVVDWEEDDSLGGFTGQDIFDRLAYEQYEETRFADVGVWEIYGFRNTLSIEALVDEVLMASVYLREAVMQPTSRGAGYGDVAAFVDYVVAFDFPADAHVQRPVVYPADGQLDVPPSYYALEPTGAVDAEWLPYAALRGYPITLTFGGTTADGAWNSASNVYGIQLESLELQGPEGLVDLDWSVPGDELSLLNFTIAVVPRNPLDVSATYTLRASGTKMDGDWEVESVFYTALDDTPANVEVLEMLGGDPAPTDWSLDRLPDLAPLVRAHR